MVSSRSSSATTPTPIPGIKQDAAASTDQRMKSQYAAQTVAAYTVIAFASSRVSLNFQLALGIFLTYQLWNLFWLKILLFSPSMYSIKVPTGIIEDWIQVSVPCAAIHLRKDRIVTSISELSGIRGTHMMLAVRIMSGVINALLLVAINVDMKYREADLCLLSCTTNADYVPLCMYIFCVGQFLAGHFELNLKDPFHTQMHYIGVLGIFVGTLMIGFVTNWSTLSLVMIGLEYGVCAYWFYVCATVKHKSKDLEEVTKNSKKCVAWELAIFFVTNAIIVLTVNGCGPNEGNVFAPPF